MLRSAWAFDDCRGGVHDSGSGRDHRFDFSQLDSLTPQLHLEVRASQVFQFARAAPPHQITGPVDP